MGKNQLNEDAWILTTKMVGVVSKSAGILCLVANILAQGHATLAYAVIASLKRNLTAIVGKNAWMSNVVIKIHQSRARIILRQELKSGWGIGPVRPNAKGMFQRP